MTTETPNKIKECIHRVKLEFTVKYPGFRRRLRRLTGVGFHPQSEFGLRAFGAAAMKTNDNPRDCQDRFGSQARRHRQFFRIALAADRQILFFPSPAL